MKAITLIFVILYLIWAIPLYSGEGEWTNIGGPPGGHSLAVDFHPSGSICYANIDSFLVVSSDNGQTWQLTNHPHVGIKDIKVGKIDDNNHYVFTGIYQYGIYRAQNGVNWQYLTGGTVTKITVSRNSAQYVYAIIDGDIHASTN